MRKLIISALACLIVSMGMLAGQDPPKEAPKEVAQPVKVEQVNSDKNTHKATTNRIWRPVTRHPDGGHFIHLTADREAMKGKDQKIHFKLDVTKKHAVQLPIDWVKGYSFPMDLNDTFGDCYYAAGCHADNLWTANAGAESTFGQSAIKTRYFALSGGDNGLADEDMQGEMMNRYLADVPAAKIISWANIDTTDPAAMQAAIQKYGAVIFTFSVPSNWGNNSDTGAIWTTPVSRFEGGHAVVLGGVDAAGKYKLLTWGTYVWLTPAGLNACQPSGWIAFSSRWFNAQGYAPNGVHIVDLAKTWQADTGKAIPASVISAFPPPGVGPTPPTPTPTPIPTPGIVPTIRFNQPYQSLPAGEYELLPVGSRQKLLDILGPMAP